MHALIVMILFVDKANMQVYLIPAVTMREILTDMSGVLMLHYY